jgi:hypothetical protein
MRLPAFLSRVLGLFQMIARDTDVRAEHSVTSGRREAVDSMKSLDLAPGAVVSGTIRWKDIAGGKRLPERLTCYNLDVEGAPIESLPEGLVVQFRLNARRCEKLVHLPAGLRAGSILLRGCTALPSLPERVDTYFLDISDCPQIVSWPKEGNLRVGRLRAQNCVGLRGLPPWLKKISQLDLCGCAGVETLPDDLEVGSWVDVAGTGIRSLPAAMAETPLRWRGVPIDERIAFRPEAITAAEVLAERNAEVRRVKLERMGLDRFLTDAKSQTLDEDTDAGGPRQLLRVEWDGDEPLVCILVRCPSTARRYALRVPPQTRTCRQAVAWVAGFDNPDDYRPLVET